MCESNVFLKKDGKEEKFLEEVEVLRPEGEYLYMSNIDGTEKRLKGKIINIDFVEHKVLIAED